MLRDKQNLKNLEVRYYARKRTGTTFPQACFGLNIFLINCYVAFSRLLKKEVSQIWKIHSKYSFIPLL